MIIIKLYKKYYGNKKLSKLFTCFLVSIILVLSILIYKEYYPDKFDLLKSKIYNETFNFMDFKNMYNKISGVEESTTVSLEVLNYKDKEKYKNGSSYIFKSEEIIKNITDGIVVFSGNKEGYNNTVIIQGVDGYDIWYGNLENVNVNIYDYVKGGSLIGSTDKLYIVIMKDNKYYEPSSYQSYL